MAKIIERPEADDNEEYSTLEVQENQVTEEVAESPAETETEDDIPDKYRNKDIREVVRMHQEAEKLLGKQSSEVGELRKIVDDFVKTQLETQKSPITEVESPEIDFFDDPKTAVEQAIASHPALKEIQEYGKQAKQSSILAQLEQNHPDYKDIIQDTAFAEWVQASKVRTELFVRADQNFDYDSANELLSLWKERQNIVRQTEEVQKQDRKNQVKAASTGSAKGSAEPQSRKVYRRSDIIELMQKDPKRYQQLSDEIMAAYAEGRVK